MLRRFALSMASVAFAASIGGATAAEEVNVYSYRQPFLVEPLFKAVEEDKGIRVNMLFAEAGPVERLQAEWDNTPGDLVFAVDIGRLNDVKEAGVAAPGGSSTPETLISAQHRDPDGHWFELTLRARVIFASKARVEDWKSLTCESLAGSRFKGRVRAGSGKHPYHGGAGRLDDRPSRPRAGGRLVGRSENQPGAQAQHIYAEQSYEYPVRAGVEWSPLLKDLGPFKADELPIAKIAELRTEAVNPVDEVGFDG